MDNGIKKTALAAVKKAGRVLLGEYKNFDRQRIRLKSHHEILTRADLLSEEIIIKEIRKKFPRHRILSEEAGELKSTSDYIWIIDPLDGTTNFSMHNPLWSVSLALAYREELVMGLVYAPVLSELFSAAKGRGAYLNGRKIKVSGAHGPKTLNTFCHGREEKHVRQALRYYAYQKLHALDCRQLGSAAIELAYVASGRIESIVIPGANAWDVAAGILLVREAGGRVTDFAGKDWNLNGGDMIASNGRVHSEILGVLRKK